MIRVKPSEPFLRHSDGTDIPKNRTTKSLRKPYFIVFTMLFNARHFPCIFPNPRPSPSHTALDPLGHPPFDLSSSSFLLLKWENDGRTMGELRTKERKKSDRIHIGHRAGKRNKTVIIRLSIPHVTALPLNGFCRRTA
jgi:hypothetical protein